jgi:phytol kinase
VVLIALLEPNKWIFLAAMLHLALADAMAALIGKRYGKSTKYKVFGQSKSLIGSLTFYIISLAITTIVVNFTPLGQASLPVLLLLPPLVTLAENVSFFGSDNFVIPAVVVLFLQIG